jgi:hypothetical protein
MLLGCLLKLPPDHNVQTQPTRDFVHHLLWVIHLRGMPLGLEKVGAIY